MTKFKNRQRVRIERPYNSERTPLVGLTGTVHRLRRCDDLAWIKLDTDPPEGFAVFPQSDERHRHLLADPVECAAL